MNCLLTTKSQKLKCQFNHFTRIFNAICEMSIMIGLVEEILTMDNKSKNIYDQLKSKRNLWVSSTIHIDIQNIERKVGIHV